MINCLRQIVVCPGWIFCLVVVVGSTAAGGEHRRANVLLIVGDDMGYADVGFHGCRDIPTPHLDRLATGGARFSNGYVSGPYCSPTRAGLLTGRYQQRFGHEFNPGGPMTGLPVSETTIADRLKSAGYATALVGKWHLGSQASMRPQRRGFDEFFGFLGGAHSYLSSENMLRGDEPIGELDYSTDAFGREAVSFIERHQQKPWFLYLAFNAVHTPMHATEERLASVSGIRDPQRRTYGAMLLAMDEAIGSVLETLEKTGQRDQTLVMFVSDNGGPTMPGVTVNGSINTPLRGSKRTTLEGGIRVPFVVSWPGRIRPAVINTPVIQLDLAATALAAVGVVPDAPLDGVNLLPCMEGIHSGPVHDALYWRFGSQMAIRNGDFKLVRYDSQADQDTVRRNATVTDVRLYNLARDPGETQDLAASMPDKVRQLQDLWNAWNSGNVAPLWGSGRQEGAAGESGRAGKKNRTQAAETP